MKLPLRLWDEEQGRDLVEYALLLALIVLGANTAVSTLGKAVSDAFARI